MEILNIADLYEHKSKTSTNGYSHDGIYRLVGFCRMKDITTGTWYDGVMYKKGKSLFVREKKDFINKFKKITDGSKD